MSQNTLKKCLNVSKMCLICIKTSFERLFNNDALTVMSTNNLVKTRQKVGDTTIETTGFLPC